MPQEKKEFNLPELEEKILKFWEENKIFEKSLAKNKGREKFVFYEGPPTANGSPGIHHFEARAFKDIIPRFKTMRGFLVERKAGWDTHGLPVELEVEKELGLKSKRDIEKYGIARFNEKCRESVWKYKEEWDRFTKRIGFWLDLKNPYITYETSYIESLWWIIKEIWKKGLLYQDFKVLPWCPRCQTGLSTHELGLGYKTVKDRAVYVKFFIPSLNSFILSWTTTPWTLPGNVALAINPHLSYIIATVRQGEKKERLILAEKQIDILRKKRFEVVTQEPLGAKKLLGVSYQPLFNVGELKERNSYKIYPADFVKAEEGTGVVHTAVMYGEDDYELGKKVGLPRFHTVEETGHFIKELGEGLGGQYVKDQQTEEKIIASLKRRGFLFSEELYEHDYPFCWRCDTALLYYARQGWWIRMSALKKELAANNKTIHWVPEHLKPGRFGEFLKEIRDWAFSRERFWGTPLPIWQCQSCKEIRVVGGLEDLKKLSAPPQNKYWIMRHGEAENNLKKVYSTAWPEVEKSHLTPKGQTQVERAAERLKKEKIDFIISSPFARTKETAELLASHLHIKVEYDVRIREMHWGSHGMPEKEADSSFSFLEAQFWSAVPGGETFIDVRTRVFSLLRDLEKKYSDKVILIVSHGDPLWMLASVAQGFSSNETISRRNMFSMGKGAYAKLEYEILPRNDAGEIDFHKPYIDEIELSCPKCKNKMARVKEVADVWFDSGAMPFAQAHYPFAFVQNQKSKIKNQKLLYPADFISEAIDQTRGWFYTLLAVATLLGRGAPYKNVISLGLVLDKNGQKMSKSRGNVVNPWDMIKKYGSDTIRWYFYTINSPGDPKKFDEKDLLDKKRNFLATLWNIYVFFETYVDKISSSKFQITKSKNILDQWIMEKLNVLASEATQKLEQYDIVSAARLIEDFTISDFSQWYLRRSRRRFQQPESAKEKKQAEAVLSHLLLTLITVSAPFVPFISEAIFQELKKKMKIKEASVHLMNWPQSAKIKKTSLIEDMAETRKISSQALKARADAGIKVRQPLASLQIRNPKSEIRKNKKLLDLIREEVNVKEITFGSEMKLDTTITPELKEEGMLRELIRNVQEMRRDLGLKPQDFIQCDFSGAKMLQDFLRKKESRVKKEIRAKAILFESQAEFSAKRELDFDGERIIIGVGLP